MTLILSGTDGLSDVDGSAATPAIRGTDANTGIFFPAADTIAFSEGGVESMRIDSSGNVGIGVTPSAWSGSVPRAIQVGTGSYLATNTDGTLQLGTNGFYNGSNFIYTLTGFAGRYAFSTTNGSHSWLNAASGTAGNTISFTQAMTLDASGNLGIGTTSPSAIGALYTTIDIRGTSGGGLRLGSTATSGGLIYGNAGGLTYQTEAALAHTFYANNVEAARITSGGGGVFMVGATTAHAFGIPSIQAGGSNGDALISVRRSVTTTADQIIFYNPNGLVGRIETTGSATAYTTSSDYRLKNTIAPMTGALAKVALLKPCTYKWNADGSNGEGFIAHELAEVVPQCVTGEKDAVNEDGSIKPQGIDTSFLVATLTAAIQEQQAIIQTLTDRITALEQA